MYRFIDLSETWKKKDSEKLIFTLCLFEVKPDPTSEGREGLQILVIRSPTTRHHWIEVKIYER